MKKLLKCFKLTLYRLFVNPCHRCIREGNCELFRMQGFCGDWGECWYEEKDGE